MCARARVRGGEFGLGCNEPIPIHCCFRCHRRAPNLFSHFMTEKTQPFTCVLWNIYSNIPNVLIGKPHHNPRNWVSVQWPKSLFCDSITRNTHQCRRHHCHHRIFRKCKLENLHLINSTSEHSNNTRTHTHHSNIRIASLSILPFSTCVCVFLFFSHILLAHLPFSFARHFFRFSFRFFFFSVVGSVFLHGCVCVQFSILVTSSRCYAHTHPFHSGIFIYTIKTKWVRKKHRERRATTMEKQRIKYPFANSFNFSKCTNTHTHTLITKQAIGIGANQRESESQSEAKRCVLWLQNGEQTKKEQKRVLLLSYC